MGKVHSYSFHNTMHIALKDPITQSYRINYLEKLGRYLKSGIKKLKLSLHLSGKMKILKRKKIRNISRNIISTIYYC